MEGNTHTLETRGGKKKLKAKACTSARLLVWHRCTFLPGISYFTTPYVARYMTNSEPLRDVLESACFKKVGENKLMKILFPVSCKLSQSTSCLFQKLFTCIHKTWYLISRIDLHFDCFHEMKHHYPRKQVQSVQLRASICQNISLQHFLNKHKGMRWPLNCFLTHTKSTEVREILWKEL